MLLLHFAEFSSLSLRRPGEKQVYLKVSLHHVVFCFSSICEMWEELISELEVTQESGGARGLPAVCLSSSFGGFVLCVAVCIGQLPSEWWIHLPPQWPTAGRVS